MNPDKAHDITRLYMVRHCESDRTVKDGRVRPLTPKGYADADKLVGYFANITIDRAYSSPYQRAVETIRPLAQSRGLAITIKHDLHERVSDREPIEDWPAFHYRQWMDFTYTLNDGEAIGTVQARNIAALREIVSEAEGGTVIVGTHGTALLTIMNHFDKRYGYEELMRILPIMPYIVRLDFSEGKLVGLLEIDPAL